MDWLPQVRRIAAETGKLLSEFDREQMNPTTKGGIELVTEADFAAEAFILGEIRELAPDHDVLSEESAGVTDYPPSEYWTPWRGKEWLWIVDPLDGTVNFTQGLPVWSVSIALYHLGKPVVGVVSVPPLGLEFEAQGGQGAWLRERGERHQIHVSSRSELSDSVLATGFPYDKNTSEANNLRELAKMVPRIRGLRRYGSAAVDLCLVAAGRLDGYWELKLKPWDSAAGGLIVAEAGGMVTALDGQPWDCFNESVVAAPPTLHPAILAVVGQV